MSEYRDQQHATEQLMLVSPAIERYAAAHSSPVPPLLDEVYAVTRERMEDRAGMLSGQVEGVLLQTLLRAMGARRVLEIGTFTGAAALVLAEALPADGQVITCELDPEAIAVARRFFARSPHGQKIELREGLALATLATLDGPFDLVFIDADKENYTAYYEASLPLLAPHGIIAVDNVLWSGRVLDPREPRDHAIVAFNNHVRADPRVTCVLLTVRDGVMLIQRRAEA